MPIRFKDELDVSGLKTNPYNLSRRDRIEADKILDPLVEEGCVEPVPLGHPLAASSPAFIVWNKGKPRLVVDLRKVLSALEASGVSLSIKKCHFGYPSIQLLGHHVSRLGYSTLEEKVDAIRKKAFPKTLKQLETGIGFFGYYRKYVGHYSSIAEPLQRLKTIGFKGALVKGRQRDQYAAKTTLTDGTAIKNLEEEDREKLIAEAKAAWEKLKEELTAAPTLAYPDFSLPFKLYMDGSYEHGFGAAVHQVQDGALQKVPFYFDQGDFEVVTDYSPILGLCKEAKGRRSQRLDKWALFLSKFHPRIKITHRAGKKHANADGLSRLHDEKDSRALSVTVIGLQEPFLDQIRDGLNTDKAFTTVMQKVRAMKKAAEKADEDTTDREWAYHSFVWRADGLLYHIRAGHPDRLCIPVNVERTLLESAHDHNAHLGLKKAYDKGFDAFATVTCKYSKWIHILPGKETWTAGEWAHAFFDQVVRYHTLPDAIVSDRDAKFTSSFWRHLMSKCKVAGHMTAAYHPAADGQSERTNQSVEIALRCLLVGEYEERWVDIIAEVERCLNCAYNASIGMSAFEALYGYPPRIDFARGSEHNEAQEFVEARELIRKDLEDAVQLANARMAFFFDEKHEPPHFQGKVFISSKLSTIRMGPYPIKRRVGQLAYELELPSHTRIHPVISCVHLEPFHEDAHERRMAEPVPIIVDGEAEWVVEKLLRAKGKGEQQRILGDARTTRIGFGTLPKVVYKGVVYYVVLGKYYPLFGNEGGTKPDGFLSINAGVKEARNKKGSPFSFGSIRVPKKYRDVRGVVYLNRTSADFQEYELRGLRFSPAANDESKIKQPKPTPTKTPPKGKTRAAATAIPGSSKSKTTAAPGSSKAKPFFGPRTPNKAAPSPTKTRPSAGKDRKAAAASKTATRPSPSKRGASPDKRQDQKRQRTDTGYVNAIQRGREQAEDALRQAENDWQSGRTKVEGVEMDMRIKTAQAMVAFWDARARNRVLRVARHSIDQEIRGNLALNPAAERSRVLQRTAERYEQLDELVADMTDSEAEDSDDAADDASNVSADEAAADEEGPDSEWEEPGSKSPPEVPMHSDDGNGKGDDEAGPSGVNEATSDLDDEPDMESLEESSPDSSPSKTALTSSKARRSSHLRGSGRNRQPVKTDKKGKGKARA
ncbi:hypothetical protein EPUS_09241 [Endocarpon pusillum Z07020]|uniref:Integrase catalytic domain-containing protein n=1 Tax=Endocarpon pusillum (strain Z07020 / HMAS-L-300199) TaxID=1263415 RepID=U1HGQ6_ENDPU|nr:uncharacterized protein EPUS_09241 [Endocarpon pusillum Z07020]ERF69335.1 hypothetical protein EPUS_09241 [Endocarpon pusillum Z07020]